MARQWKFNTAKLQIEFTTRREHGYQYDGEDPNGETQAKLDSGEYTAFSSHVVVYLRDTGEELAADSLWGSVYAQDEAHDFWTAHRDANPMNRNCTAMRLANGGDVDAKISICHYFPDMVRTACADARKVLRQRQGAMPRLRHA